MDYIEKCIERTLSPYTALRDGVPLGEIIFGKGWEACLKKVVEGEQITFPRPAPKKVEEPYVPASSADRKIVLKDDPQLDALLKSLLEEHPQAVADYKSGKPQSIGFLIGQARVKTGRGPQELRTRLEKLLA